MTITAKFASRCASCGQSVTPGQKIEWTQGAPVRHTACQPTAQALGARVTRADMLAISARPGRSTRTRTGCSCGSIEEYSRDSDCRSCRFDQDDE